MSMTPNEVRTSVAAAAGAVAASAMHGAFAEKPDATKVSAAQLAADITAAVYDVLISRVEAKAQG